MSVPDETVLQSLATVSYTKQVAGTCQVEQVRDTWWSKDDFTSILPRSMCPCPTITSSTSEVLTGRTLHITPGAPRVYSGL